MDGRQCLHITEAAWDHLDRLAQRPALNVLQQAWKTIPEALRNYEKAFLRVRWSIRTTLRNKKVLFILRIKLKHYNKQQLMLSYHLSFSLASLNMKIIHSEDIRQQYSCSVNEPFIYSVSVSLHQIIPVSHQQYFLFIKKTVQKCVEMITCLDFYYVCQPHFQLETPSCVFVHVIREQMMREHISVLLMWASLPLFINQECEKTIFFFLFFFRHFTVLGMLRRFLLIRKS